MHFSKAKGRWEREQWGALKPRAWNTTAQKDKKWIKPAYWKTKILPDVRLTKTHPKGGEIERWKIKGWTNTQHANIST